MSRVIDYAWGRPSIAVLRSMGTVAVCRYLAFESYQTRGKLLTSLEVATLTSGGIAIVSNWEQAGSWAEYSGGYNTGVRHATEAARQHTRCGGPADRPIYFSTDFDATSAQLPTVADYYRGVASVIGLDRTGAYGGYRTIKYLLDHGVIRWAWQTFAWSGGQWDPRVQLRQIRNGVAIDGVDCDINESRTRDFGQWGVKDVGQFEYSYNADANAWAVRTGAAPPVYPAGQPGTTTPAGNPLWDLLRGLNAKLDAIAAKVDIDPAELAAVTEAARQGAAFGASAAEIVTELLARLPASASLTRDDIEAGVLAALRAGTGIQ